MASQPLHHANPLDPSCPCIVRSYDIHDPRPHNPVAAGGEARCYPTKTAHEDLRVW